VHQNNDKLRSKPRQFSNTPLLENMVVSLFPLTCPLVQLGAKFFDPLAHIGPNYNRLSIFLPSDENFPGGDVGDDHGFYGAAHMGGASRANIAITLELPTTHSYDYFNEPLLVWAKEVIELGRDFTILKQICRVGDGSRPELVPALGR
jgi:hypothetical protein